MKKNALLMVLIAAVGCMSLQAQEMEMVMAEEQMAAPADPEVAQEIEGKLARFKRVMRCLRKKDGCTAEEISQAYKIVTGIIGTVAVLGTGIGLGVKKYGMPRWRKKGGQSGRETVAKVELGDAGTIEVLVDRLKSIHSNPSNYKKGEVGEILGNNAELIKNTDWNTRIKDTTLKDLLNGIKDLDFNGDRVTDATIANSLGRGIDRAEVKTRLE